MALNPMTIRRKPVPRPVSRNQRNLRHTGSKYASILAAVSAVIILIATVHWFRRWLLSGAALQSVLVLYAIDHPRTDSIFPLVPLWTILATLNLGYAVCSTSWLLYGLFTAVCYPAILLTSLATFPVAGYWCRKVLRKTLGKNPHFMRDQLALFDLPALEIDTDVDGLFVIRGITIQFSTLTIVGHGIEVGIKLTGDIELAICVDKVTISLFRRIDIGDVFANVKGGQFEMTFGDVDDNSMNDSLGLDGVFLEDTPLLRAATAGPEGFKDGPKLRESLSGVGFIKDSSAQAGLESVTKLSPDDELADHEYRERLAEIRTTSSIYQARQHVQRRAKEDEEYELKDDKSIRAAISQELHSMSSVAHPPSRSVRVSTLQNMSSPRTRRFMHRLPFLLRLLLAPLSYLHPVNIESINAAGSGQWVSELLQQEVFKSYLETSAELRRLHHKVSTWLANATFCLQLADINGLASVPLSTAFDIIARLKFNDVMGYRTAQQSGAITQVVRLGGADATFTIPSYLLPHHEHIIPPKPTLVDRQELKSAVGEADGLPQTVQAAEKLDKAEKDESSIAMSVHASLPATFDQTLLNFIAALVKATKIIELEKEVVDADLNSPTSTRTSIDSQHPSVATSDSSYLTSTVTDDDDTASINSTAKTNVDIADVVSFKMKVRNIRQNLMDGSYNTTIKGFAKELHQNTKDGMKKAVVGGLVNDRWIAKIVGKTAMALQRAQGDVGYSGGIPIPLAPYRGTKEMPSKLLP
ncbi:hypothetical protein F4860DRAFT_97650 [Xylaria cubensis]|nr:hypothetical protein F4860DRAFT_97650 [Xylaria cubensis]